MAGFSVTYDSLLKNNIKHIHYGKPLSFIFRESPEYPNMDQLRKMEGDRNLKRQLYGRVFLRSEEPPIPPAPAYNTVTAEQLRAIVDRLHRPTLSHPISKQQLPPIVDKGVAASSRREHLTRTQKISLFRLNTPTHASRLRAQKDPDVIRRINQPIADNKVCVRFAV